MSRSKSHSCFGCVYHNQGNCSWFVGRAKLIPIDVLYKGCKHRIPKIKEVEGSPIIDKIIDIFDGEFI